MYVNACATLGMCACVCVLVHGSNEPDMEGIDGHGGRLMEVV